MAARPPSIGLQLPATPQTPPPSCTDERFSVALRVKPLPQLQQPPAFIISDKDSLAKSPSSKLLSGSSGSQGMSHIALSPQFSSVSPKFTGVDLLCYSGDTTTQTIYNNFTKLLVEGCFNGYSGTLFAYGQTSSGKTFTVLGDQNSKGLLWLAIEDILERAKSIAEATGQFTQIFVSFYEVYNEKLRDLFHPEHSDLYISEKGVMLDQTCRDPVLPVGPMTSVQQIYDLVCEGQRNRSTAITKMNEQSSRSHAIISLSLKIPVEKLSSTWANATLNFVDLAGSERIPKVGENAQIGNINCSLMTLKAVVRSLAKKADFHAYRDSKLTYLLKPFLQGDTRTAFICCISNEEQHIKESVDTILFAQEAEKSRPAAHASRQSESLEKSISRKRPREPAVDEDEDLHLPPPKRQKTRDFDSQALAEMEQNLAQLRAKVDEQNNQQQLLESKLAEQSALIAKIGQPETLAGNKQQISQEELDRQLALQKNELQQAFQQQLAALEKKTVYPYCCVQ